MRLKISDEILFLAVIKGLRSNIRAGLLQKGVTTLDEVINNVRLIEAAASEDPLHNLLIETIKANSLAADKQTSQIADLTRKLSALTDASAAQAYIRSTPTMQTNQTDINSIEDEQMPDQSNSRDLPAFRQQPTPRSNEPRPTYQTGPPQQSGGFPSRQLRQTPQNMQRANYSNHLSQRRDMPPSGQRFHDQRRVQFQEPPASHLCPHCGGRFCRPDRPDSCRAAGSQCRRCGGYNHWSRFCESVRRQD